MCDLWDTIFQFDTGAPFKSYVFVILLQWSFEKASFKKMFILQFVVFLN